MQKTFGVRIKPCCWHCVQATSMMVWRFEMSKTVRNIRFDNGVKTVKQVKEMRKNVKALRKLKSIGEVV
jgi:hypothetical protein